VTAAPPTAAPTPETLTRHELCGLRVRVAAASNPALVGIEGRVVAETMRTLVVESVERADDEAVRRTRRVPKRGATFEFALPTCEDGRDDGPATGRSSETSTDEAAGGREAPGTASERPAETVGVRPDKSPGCEGVAYVTVDGSRLLSRPAHRTENAGDTTWR
jgi:ribonuclease P protein subunit POP4